MKKTIFTQNQNRGLGFYIGKFIDERSNARLYLKSRAFNSARGDKKLAIFANDHIGININNYGVYEKFELDLLFDFLRPISDELKLGSALDVGANIGNHSVYFSSHFTSVYSFEPNPDTFYLLSYNSNISNNIHAYNYGLGDSEEVLDLHVNPDNMGASAINYSGSANEKKIKISVKKLDDLDVGFANISFVKIDVEGFEDNVIKGGIRLIESHMPIIVFEQLEREFCKGSTKAIDRLVSLGYRICWIQEENYKKSWILRRIDNMNHILFGKRYSYYIVTDDVVPVATYSMLIAIPERFQNKLFLHSGTR